MQAKLRDLDTSRMSVRCGRKKPRRALKVKKGRSRLRMRKSVQIEGLDLEGQEWALKQLKAEFEVEMSKSCAFV